MEHEIELEMGQVLPGLRSICKIAAVLPDRAQELLHCDEISDVPIGIAVKARTVPVAQQQHWPTIFAIKQVIVREAQTQPIDWVLLRQGFTSSHFAKHLFVQSAQHSLVHVEDVMVPYSLREGRLMQNKLWRVCNVCRLSHEERAVKVWHA
eukprot:591265-Rhodomonas_salina.1